MHYRNVNDDDDSNGNNAKNGNMREIWGRQEQKDKWGSNSQGSSVPRT